MHDEPCSAPAAAQSSADFPAPTTTTDLSASMAGSVSSLECSIRPRKCSAPATVGMFGSENTPLHTTTKSTSTASSSPVP